MYIFISQNLFRSILVLETPIKGLNVSEDALPIWTSHNYHVLDIKQWRDTGFISRFECQIKVLPAVLWT